MVSEELFRKSGELGSGGMRKYIKVVFAVLTAAMMMVAAGGCSGQQTVTIGIDSNAKPLSYRGEDGTPDGFIVELSREAARRMGVSVKFKFVNIDDKSKAFSKNGVDVLWGKLEATDENKKNMLFTREYMTDSQILVVNADSVIETVIDLKGKSVGAVKKSDAEKALLNSDLISQVKDSNSVKFDDLTSAFSALDKSRVDALAVDLSYACNSMSAHAEQYRILNTVLSSKQYAAAVRRNDALLRDKLEKALKDLQEDGTSTSISKKWFGRDLTDK